MKDDCPYPGCVLSDWHEGDHDFKKPYGDLVMVQRFESDYQRCDICPELPARALYRDARGRGFALCLFCEQELVRGERIAA